MTFNFILRSLINIKKTQPSFYDEAISGNDLFLNINISVLKADNWRITITATNRLFYELSIHKKRFATKVQHDLNHSFLDERKSSNNAYYSEIDFDK